MEESKPSDVIPSGDSAGTETIDEQKLIGAAQLGDKRAFGLLIRRHQKRLFRFIYGLIGSFDQTEDVVQEAFVRAYRAIGTFHAGYAFYPWLSTIARNLTFNQISREEKKESLEQMVEKGFDPDSGELGPMDELLEKEGQKRFYTALKSMPIKYRSVFVLRHFEEMDYSQIASYLKIPPGTVDSRLHRARQYLMAQLEDLL